MPFSAFFSRLQGIKVMYCNNHFLDFKGKIYHFFGSFGIEKDLLNKIFETICRSLRTHDEIEMQTLSLCFAFVLSSLHLRSKSVSKPLQVRS